MNRDILFICLIILTPLLGFGQSEYATENIAEVVINVTQKDKQPIPHKELIVHSSKSTVAKKYKTDEEGNVTLYLPKGANYSVKYLIEKEDWGTANIDLPSNRQIQTFYVDIEIWPGKQWVLENVFFDTNKSTLRPESKPALEELVGAMKGKPTMQIELQGHTDNVGSDAANLQLSHKRANAVRSYLIRRGIRSSRVIARGYGESKPIASNESADGRQKNRRTEVKLLKE